MSRPLPSGIRQQSGAPTISEPSLRPYAREFSDEYMKHFTLSMNAYPLFLLILVFIFLTSFSLCSCAEEALLNSDRIRQAFGNYAVDVLQADDEMRISSLYSVSVDPKLPRVKTTRTLALVRFLVPRDPSLAREHEAIVNGASIGETFRNSGWSISKENLLLCELSLTLADLPALSGMHIASPATLALHRYRFSVRRDSVAVDYAIIEEIHHPDYLSLGMLEGIYEKMPKATEFGTSVCSVALSLPIFENVD